MALTVLAGLAGLEIDVAFYEVMVELFGGRPTARVHETSVIETVATSHVIRVLLSERME